MINIKKYWKKRGFLFSLPISIYFNFYYLPFRQAIRLPILLFKPKLLKLKGKIILNTTNIYPGMIRLGYPYVSIYPDTGIAWENTGGVVIFKGKCTIGGNSYVSIGNGGQITFGGQFLASSSLKIVCMVSIEFGFKNHIGWNTIIMDTNFHPLIDMNKNVTKSFSGPILIGDYNWFGLECVVMYGVKIPDRCIFGLKTVITHNSKFESYSLHVGNPLRIVATNVMREFNNDIFHDSEA